MWQILILKMFWVLCEHPFASEPIARSNGCATVRTYTGHGVNDLFHCSPNIPHYAKNKAVGTMKPGMVSRKVDLQWPTRY